MWHAFCPLHLHDENTNNNKIWIKACLLAACRLSIGNTCTDCLVGRFLYAVCRGEECQPENSRLDTRIAREDFAAAIGDFLPSVSTTGALGKRLGRSVDPKTNMYTSSSFLESTMGLDISLPVFDGFTRVNRAQFTRLNQQISGLTEKVEENRIAFEVMDAYYLLLLKRRCMNWPPNSVN